MTTAAALSMTTVAARLPFSAGAVPWPCLLLFRTRRSDAKLTPTNNRLLASLAPVTYASLLTSEVAAS
jgi:hypothetical protein